MAGLLQRKAGYHFRASVLIRQRVQLHKRGYPSRELDYLKLIERQIEELKQVYLSFYRLAPGLIHQLRGREPEIYVWLTLQKSSVLSSITSCVD